MSKISVVQICPYKHFFFASAFSLLTYPSNLPYPTRNVLQVTQRPYYLFTPLVVLRISQSEYRNMPKIKYIHFSSDIHPPDPLQILVIAVKSTTLLDIQVQSIGTTFYSHLPPYLSLQSLHSINQSS